MPTDNQQQITDNSTSCRRLKVLISAYACEPGKGSEPGVGWQTALALSEKHEVWVLTRSNNRTVIEAELTRHSGLCLNVIYHDLPAWACRLKHNLAGLHLYYYAWHLFAIRKVRAAHRRSGFDLAHHLTFGRLRSPSCVAFLGIPFLFGPVGGGDYVPPGFENELGVQGRFYEWMRHITHALAALDPFLRKTVRSASIAIGTTDKAVEALHKLGAGEAFRASEAGLTAAEAAALGKLAETAPDTPFRFMSAGRLIGLKGFSLGLRAFAAAGIPHAEYWLIGDGPDRQRLENLARELGVSEQVRFLGWCVREKALESMGQCHVLVHPSLHDSGGWVCLEAMAAAKPVICLNWAGPGTQVPDTAGFLVVPKSTEQVIDQMAAAMGRLVNDSDLRHKMGAYGQQHIQNYFLWVKKAEYYSELYHRITNN